MILAKSSLNLQTHMQRNAALKGRIYHQDM